MKEKIIPIVSVAIGIVAFILTAQFLRSRLDDIRKERERMLAGVRTISVVAANNDIPAGTVIEGRDLKPMDIYETSSSGMEVIKTDALLLLGKKTLLEIRANKPILWPQIEGGSPTFQGLAPTIKPRMRAVSLSIGGANAVSCMVQPSDRVDVLGTFTFPSKDNPNQAEIVTLTILQDVTVLATGQQLAKQTLPGRISPSASNYGTVTLEVTPREAEMLVFSQQVQGRLTLTLRNPRDVYWESETQELNFLQLKAKIPELNRFRQQNYWRKIQPVERSSP